jgi:hypothetical protein
VSVGPDESACDKVRVRMCEGKGVPYLRLHRLHR